MTNDSLPNPLEMFKLADTYADEARAMDARWVKAHRNAFAGTKQVTLDREDSFARIPAVALRALAVEIYLKCLVVMCGRTPPATHKLDKLFQVLTSDIRDRLATLYEKHKPTGHGAIERVLTDSADAFVRFLYFYEYPVDEDPTLTPPIFESWPVGTAARHLILEINPTWDGPQTRHRWVNSPVRRYKAVHSCIYCGAKVYDPAHPSRRLGDEHIIPEGLGGHLLLPEASCRKCEAITSRIERTCLHSYFGPLRLYLGMPSKRKDRPTTLPFETNFAPDRPVKIVHVPLAECPVVVTVPLFPRPGLLSGEEPKGYEKISCTYLPSITAVNERLNQIVRRYGVRNAKLSSALGAGLPQMIAKIAHSYLTAEIGYGRFRPLVREIILGDWASQSALIGQYIGCDDEPRTRGEAGHSITSEVVNIAGQPHWLVRVWLFRNWLPEVVVIAGELTETPP